MGMGWSGLFYRFDPNSLVFDLGGWVCVVVVFVVGVLERSADVTRLLRGRPVEAEEGPAVLLRLMLDHCHVYREGRGPSVIHTTQLCLLTANARGHRACLGSDLRLVSLYKMYPVYVAHPACVLHCWSTSVSTVCSPWRASLPSHHTVLACILPSLLRKC